MRPVKLTPRATKLRIGLIGILIAILISIPLYFVIGAYTTIAFF